MGGTALPGTVLIFGLATADAKLVIYNFSFVPVV